MNYRHIYHAGNHADVLKHAIVLATLERLRAKPAPFAVLDTHAGAGLYDLTTTEAERSPEWRDGAARLLNWAEAPALALGLIEAIARCNGQGRMRWLPGSPWLILDRLRPQDRLVACELRPEEAERLRLALNRDARAHVHARDGWEALRAFTPFAEKRGVILIDPPYEDRSADLSRGVAAITLAAQRFSAASVIWWRPLKAARELDACDAELETRLGLKALRADLATAAPDPDGRMVASSVLIVNPPYGLAEQLEVALPALAARLEMGPGGYGRLNRIGRL